MSREYIAVVSSAHVHEVDEQLRARPGVEGRLFLYLSRGSEIYVVGPWFSTEFKVTFRRRRRG